MPVGPDTRILDGSQFRKSQRETLFPHPTSYTETRRDTQTRRDRDTRRHTPLTHVMYMRQPFHSRNALYLFGFSHHHPNGTACIAVYHTTHTHTLTHTQEDTASALAAALAAAAAAAAAARAKLRCTPPAAARARVRLIHLSTGLLPPALSDPRRRPAILLAF